MNSLAKWFLKAWWKAADGLRSRGRAPADHDYRNGKQIQRFSVIRLYSYSFVVCDQLAERHVEGIRTYEEALDICAKMNRGE